MNDEKRCDDRKLANKRKRRHIRNRLFLLLFLCILVTGILCCKTKRISETSVSPLQNRSMFSWIDKTGYCLDGYAKVQDGLIQFFHYGESKGEVMCTRKDCTHNLMKKEEENDCQAILDDLLSVCVYNDKLYAFQMTGWQETTILVRNLDDDGFHILAVLPYGSVLNNVYNFFEREKLYVNLGEISVSSEQGYYTNKDVNSVILEVDIQNGSYKELFQVEGEKNYQLFTSQIINQEIYCRFFYDDGMLLEDGTYQINEYQEQLFKFPLNGGKAERLDEAFSSMLHVFSIDDFKVQNLFFGQDGIFVQSSVDNGLTFYSYHENKEDNFFALPTQYQKMECIGESGGLLLAAEITSENQYRYVMIDLDKRKSNEFSSKNNNRYLPLVDGYFVCIENENQGNEKIGIEYYQDMFKVD